MDTGYYHIALNHFPVLGILFGIIVLIVGMIRKNDVLIKTAMITFIVAAVLTFPTMQTGEPAEEVVEHIEGVSHDVIHEHEEAGETAAIVAYVLGLMGILSLVGINKQKSWKSMVTTVTLILSLVALGLLTNTAYLGGKVRHSEFYGSETHVDHEEHEKHEHEEHD